MGVSRDFSSFDCGSEVGDGPALSNLSADRQRVLVIAGLAESLINFRGPLIKRMLRAGHEVICTAPEGDDRVATQLAKWGAMYIALPLERNRVGLLRDVMYAFRIWKLCRMVRPDVAFAYTVKPVVFGCSASSFAGVPRVYALITGLGYVFIGDSARRRLLRVIVLNLYRFALARANKVFFQNSDDRDYFMGRCGVDRNQSVIVNGSGVDLDYYEAAPIPSGSSPVFLLIARLLGNKGIREYAQAGEIIRRRYPNARFWLVGPADPSADAIAPGELDAWIGSGIIEYYCATNDVRPFLARASVYVLPSYREGTPRTVLEAMATGRPIVTTDAPGCRETVRPNYNGFLVPVRDANALARAMTRFIVEPELTSRMGVASRQFVEECFDVHKVNDVMLEAMDL